MSAPPAASVRVHLRDHTSVGLLFLKVNLPDGTADDRPFTGR